MVITNNQESAEKMRRLRNYSFEHPRFLHKEIGFNYRLTNIQAAIGLAQTENANVLVSARRSLGERYNELLKDTPELILPTEKDYAKNVYWMYGVVLRDNVQKTREEIVDALKSQGVDTRNFFIPMHEQPVFLEKKVENSPDCSDSFPVAEKIGKRGFYLPSSSNLTDKNLSIICANLKKILQV